MNFPTIHHFSSYALSFLKDSVDAFLTPQQKKIIAVASIAFGWLAALYLFFPRDLFGKAKEHRLFPDGSEADGVFDENDINDFRFKGRKKDFWGNIEEGQFEMDRNTSKYCLVNGKKTLPDGTIYEGRFHNDKLRGMGKITYFDGKIEEGLFINGWLWGKGKISCPNGDIIEGFFTKGNFDGYVKITHPDGKVEEGLYETGVLKHQKPKPLPKHSPSLTKKAEAEEAPMPTTTTTTA